MAQHVIDISKEKTRLGDLAGKIGVPALIVGVVFTVVGVAMGYFSDAGPSRMFEGYLVNFMFFLAIALGALFFTLIHHLTRAGWSAVLRRVAEAIAANLWLMAILFVPLIFALFNENSSLFPWSKELTAGDPLVEHKAPYLNDVFFLCRAVFYFVVWIVISQYFFRLSVRQDQTGDIELSHRMTARSAPAMLFFALTLTFAAVDWLMSQDPHYFSTIWGVYYFAAATCGFFGVAIVLFVTLQRMGRIQNAVTTEHYHDLGKLLFAFGMVFWAYIAYSQYMLQWYGNIPEETNWWQPRASGYTQAITDARAHKFVEEHSYVPGAWNTWTMLLLIGHFAVPFVAMISRWPKRIKPLLVVGAVWMVVMVWFDMFWLIMPHFHPAPANIAFPFAVSDFALLLGMGGLFLGVIALRMRHVPLVAERDPRLSESLAFHNM